MSCWIKDKSSLQVFSLSHCYSNSFLIVDWLIYLFSYCKKFQNVVFKLIWKVEFQVCCIDVCCQQPASEGVFDICGIISIANHLNYLPRPYSALSFSRKKHWFLGILLSLWAVAGCALLMHAWIIDCFRSWRPVKWSLLTCEGCQWDVWGAYESAARMQRSLSKS